MQRAILTFLLLCPMVWGQGELVTVNKMTDTLYQMVCLPAGGGSNVLVSVGEDGVLVVDSGYIQSAKALEKKITELDPNGVKILINTHLHFDHTGANHLLGKNALVYSHERMRIRLTDGQYLLNGQTEASFPNATVKKDLSIHFNGEEVKLICTKGGHTDGDLIVYFTKSKIAHMGDLVFSDRFSYVDYNNGGDFKTLLETINEVTFMFPADVTFVNGHGRNYTMKDMIKYFEMMTRTADLVKAALAEGKSPRQMKKEKLLKDWDKWAKGGIGVSANQWIDYVSWGFMEERELPPKAVLIPMIQTLKQADSKAAIDKYYELKTSSPKQYAFSEAQINAVGYYLLEKGRVNEAIQIFELNVEEYPNSSNVYDSLGEGHMKAGNKDSAVKNYKKSLELDKNNQNAREMLMRLQEHTLPHSINDVVAQKTNKTIILPTREENESTQRNFKRYITQIHSMLGDSVKVVTDEEALKQDLSQCSIAAYGTINGNLWIKKHIKSLPLQINKDSITGLKNHSGENLWVKTVLNNPNNSKMPAVIYTAQDINALLNINNTFYSNFQYEIADGLRVLESACYLNTNNGLTCSLVRIDVEKTFTPDQIQSDVAHLFEKMERIHPNLYANTSKEKVSKEIAALLEEITQPITRKELFKKLMPVVTQLKDGLTYLEIPMEEYEHFTRSGKLLFPLRVFAFENRLYVSSNKYAPEVEVNSEILSINGDGVQSILKRMTSYISAERTAFCETRISNAFQKLYAYLYGDLSLCDIEVKAPNGDGVKMFSLKGIKLSQYNRMIHEIYGQFAPYKYNELEDGIGVINYWSAVSFDNFQIFLEDAFQQIKDNKIQHLVIDLRENWGGNSMFEEELLCYIADMPYSLVLQMDIKVCEETIKDKNLETEYGDISNLTEDSLLVIDLPPVANDPHDLLFKGDVYLLTSSNTYSTGAMFAAAFKHFGMGTIVGQETGGVTVSYGDVYRFELPNTKIKAGVSFKKLYLPGGKEDLRGVIPDYPVEKDPTKKTDPEMEMVLKLINEV